MRSRSAYYHAVCPADERERRMFDCMAFYLSIFHCAIERGPMRGIVVSVNDYA